MKFTSTVVLFACVLLQFVTAMPAIQHENRLAAANNPGKRISDEALGYGLPEDLKKRVSDEAVGYGVPYEEDLKKRVSDEAVGYGIPYEEDMKKRVSDEAVGYGVPYEDDLDTRGMCPIRYAPG
ncbi:uncharacterized protein C8Q71DRAFT_114729 [Rhodofomes roseus]|uniref:Uncharacterized protein n=1 Tax=Rhodofomes roseus TaxID=34475 RepID=A0ABQ8KCM2_9APHY|nr:uncharacterized protein C8Q71DRAFT_114729 [Rhodofomes roseus]KAH9835350.1 hypothetical protein C8Q71DRAFT_114729 [Rhodofomes roseus]